MKSDAIYDLLNLGKLTPTEFDAVWELYYKDKRTKLNKFLADHQAGDPHKRNYSPNYNELLKLYE